MATITLQEGREHGSDNFYNVLQLGTTLSFLQTRVTFRAEVVALLLEKSLLTLEVCSLNPVMSEFLNRTFVYLF